MGKPPRKALLGKTHSLVMLKIPETHLSQSCGGWGLTVPWERGRGPVGVALGYSVGSASWNTEASGLGRAADTGPVQAPPSLPPLPSLPPPPSLLPPSLGF